jgi:hypothetical protein
MKLLRILTLSLLLVAWATIPASAVDIRMYQYHQAIQRMLNKGDTVHIGIIVDKVSTALAGDWVENWKSGVEQSTYVDIQNSVLRYSGFMVYPSFSLIDRAGIEGVLKELNFQQTGYLTTKDQQKMGELLGLTHILFVSYSRFTASPPYDFCDQCDLRLVEVKTARVLATDTTTAYRYAGEDRWTPWNFKNPF